MHFSDATQKEAYENLAAAKKDMIYIISYFRLPQPFKVFLTPEHNYRTGVYVGNLACSVKINGRKTVLYGSKVDQTTIEETLLHSIRLYESKRNA